MAIITAGELTDLYNQRAFRANGSTVTLKKISETDWILVGGLAEGDSEGFPAIFSCESRTIWGDEAGYGVAFGVSMGETFHASTDYGYGLDVFFAYDSSGTRQTTGSFTTVIPDGVDWMLLGWNADGSTVLVVKPLDGVPSLSGEWVLLALLSSSDGEESLYGVRGSLNEPLQASIYGGTIQHEVGKVVCVQARAEGLA